MLKDNSSFQMKWSLNRLLLTNQSWFQMHYHCSIDGLIGRHLSPFGNLSLFHSILQPEWPSLPLFQRRKTNYFEVLPFDILFGVGSPAERITLPFNLNFSLPFVPKNKRITHILIDFQASHLLSEKPIKKEPKNDYCRFNHKIGN